MQVQDLFLTSEERYDVYSVKSSERPHLLETYNHDETCADEKDDPPPLVDGCDISGWRSAGMVPSSPHLEAALNVGLGCPLLRRERQLPLPIISNKTSSPWEMLRDYLLNQPTTHVERIPCSIASQPIDTETKVGKNRFSKWEVENYPVIITEAITDQDWNLEHWRYDNLVERFGDVRWRFSDTHGAMMSLETYHKYALGEGLTDDSPLGVYDSEFGDDNSPMHSLIQDYTVPPCFSEDLFALALEDDDDNKHADDDSSRSRAISEEESTSSTKLEPKTRPPWRWILMGPPRSGTGLHIDPLWTNAWVALLEGKKRWVLIPPHLTSALPEGAGLVEPQIPSVNWFRDYYEQVIQLEGVVEILQCPGETVFVPQGWPHIVCNLERTVAVTHNYASEFGPFERMWDQVLQDEPEFAQRWYKGLCRYRPDLAARISVSEK